jgi:hypothetical protein
MTAKIFCLSTAILACCSTQALADSECDKGFRDTTAAERTTMTNVLSAALAALPAPPTGWIMTADEQARGPQSLCRDYETQPLSYSTRRYLSRVDNLEERDRTFNAALSQSNAVLATKQPRIDALNAKLEEIAKKIGEAATKGDLARAQALNEEADAVGAQLRAVYDENDQTDQITAAGLGNARDTVIDIEVTVNPRREAPGSGAQPIAKPTGVHSAFRWSDDPASGTQDHVLLLLGVWKAVEQRFESAPRSGAAIVTPSSLSIRIDADATRIESLISAIKIGDLAATLR